MNIKLYGQIEEIIEGLKLLAGDLGIILTDDGEKIEVHKTENECRIETGNIWYSEKSGFFRALTFYVHYRKKGNIPSKTFGRNFDRAGSMFDMSRNAVYTVESVKKFLRLHAKMGLNLFMLYTEDTYKIDGEPYFGYLRGAYTHEELQSISEYAKKLGITVVPCIQTLGHLGHMLKWKCYDDIRDTGDVLLAESEKTYEFIEKMIRTCSECFDSEYIHIGMDETFGIGTGAYRAKFGEKSPVDIILSHLSRVVEIAKKYNFKPLMWSDMFFAESSKTGNYWDLENVIPESVLSQKHPDCDLVFWCYHLTKQKEYETLINLHKKFSGDTWFAGGVETYFAFAPRMALADLTINSSLKTCIVEGVKNVFGTYWGDDGQEISYFSAISGMQMYSEYMYEGNTESFAENFMICTGGVAEDFMAMGMFDDIPGKKPWSEDMSNLSKCIFWQDPLLGVFDADFQGEKLEAHYENVRAAMEKGSIRNQEYNDLFTQYAKSAEALKIKCTLWNEMSQAYRENNKTKLKNIAENKLTKLLSLYHDIYDIRKNTWFSQCKPFGFEALEVRYAGMCARIKTTIKRIEAYNCGETERLEELEIEKLPYLREGVDYSFGMRCSYNVIKGIM